MAELTCKEAGRRGGLKGGLSKSPAKLAGLAKARAARLGRLRGRKDPGQPASSATPPLLVVAGE